MFNISEHITEWKKLPRSQRLEILGLYLQYCFGDFCGWRHVPGHVWEQELVANQIENYAVNAENDWIENRGLSPQNARLLLNNILTINTKTTTTCSSYSIPKLDQSKLE